MAKAKFKRLDVKREWSNVTLTLQFDIDLKESGETTTEALVELLRHNLMPFLDHIQDV